MEGDSLSPLIFDIQINNINSLPLRGNIVCFADDTALIVTEDSWNYVLQKIKNDNNVIQTWLLENNLFLNIEKRLRFHNKYRLS